MAEILPYRRSRRWTRASDYGADPRPRGGGSGGGGGGRSGDRGRGGRGGTGDGGWLAAARETGPILWAAPLALFVAVFLATSPGLRGGGLAAAVPMAGASDRESASFGACGAGASHQACVVDGDTFWYRGAKIRVADINTPETSSPKCAAEAELGARATRRFAELMNAGAFTLEPVERSHDKYGRALFVVTRGGASVGGVLVAEGLAEEWQGYRREWC